MLTTSVPFSRRAFVALALTFSATLPFAYAAEKKSTFVVEETTIAKIHEAILAKKLTSTELVKFYLARIKAFNGPAVEEPQGILGPVKPLANAKGINALITLNLRPAARKAWGFDDRKARSMTDSADNHPKMPDALETAAALDAHFAKTGKLIGPLHGVVFSIKDQYDTFDLRTTSGADAFYANDRPPADAEFVARLRAAGAIILAKANMGEYAGGYRSSFGGVLVNPYDTLRVPGGSSGGSGTSVAANFVTVSIAEETGPSIRAPAQHNNTVGISPTQELVSRHGMINQGLNTRTGPIARTVEDAARVLSIIAGYDPKDEMTAFAVGRAPEQPYESFTKEPSLKGVRIGVMREYLDKNAFSKAEHQNIDLIERAIADLKKLGATIVDPGAGGLFTAYIRRYSPMLHNASWTKAFPELFPVDADGKPQGDHVSTLVDLTMNPAKVPGQVTIRELGSAAAVGEGKYGYNFYLARRGDAAIKTLDDLINKANFFNDPAVGGNKKPSLENANRATNVDTAIRLQRRFAVQQIVLQCMAELKLDAIISPTSLSPARKLAAPNDSIGPGVGNYGMVALVGAQGFPAITVPAGFTTQVYDRIPDPSAPAVAATRTGRRSGGGGGDDGEGGRGGRSTTPTHLADPIPAKLPVGLDIFGRPFSEPTLLKIAAAYEKATKHRAPPARFGTLPAEMTTGTQ